MKRIVEKIAIAVILTVLIWPVVSFAKEKPKVRLFLLYDMTGPYSGLHRESDLGARMYLEHWKKHQLVPEIEIVYDIYDSGNNADKSRAAMMDAFGKTPKPVLAMDGYSSAIGVVVKPLAKRHKVPVLAASSARGIMFPPEWSFSNQPDYPSHLGAVGKWVKDNWKPNSKIDWIRKHYENRNPRIAVMGWDNAFGRSCRSKESDEYFKQIGVDFVGDEYIPYAPKDVTTNLRRLRSKGAEFVYLPMYSEAHAVVLKDAKRLGIADDFMSFPFWYTDPVITQKHAGQDLLKNTVVLTGYNFILGELPDFVQRWYREELNRGESDPAMAVTALISLLDLWREVIQKAVDKFGAENVTGEACYNILTTEMIEGYTPICSTAKQAFTKNKHFGPTNCDAFMLKDGKVVRIDSKIPIPDLSPIEYRDK